MFKYIRDSVILLLGIGSFVLTVSLNDNAYPPMDTQSHPQIATLSKMAID